MKYEILEDDLDLIYKFSDKIILRSMLYDGKNEELTQITYLLF